MRAFLSLAALLAQVALANPPAVPDKHIPPTVMLELRMLENQFDVALARDCAPEKCASKGCVYRDHVVVDLPRATSLPGLQQQEGLGAVPPQEYLTQAACDFAHEKSVSPRDALALVKRLEQRLSKGWLHVSVGHQILEPISPSLSESPPLPTPPAPVEPPRPVVPEPPKEWDAKVALRELWAALLPHFSWMIAVLLGTLSVLAIIWGARRLGRESIEEKALAAQLARGVDAEKEQVPLVGAQPPSADPDAGFVDEQRRLWKARVDQADFGKDGSGLTQLLRDWLRAREYPLLAKAILLFGDRLSSTLPSDGELAARKIEFAEYLRTLDEASLPPDATFFRTLHHHTVSSALMSQSDAETYRSIGAEFGAAGVANLVTSLGQRHGALLYALVPSDLQQQVARVLTPKARFEVAYHLLESNRMSRDDQSYVFNAIDSARAGSPLPEPPVMTSHEIVDRGHEFDAAGALSVLLPFIAPAERQTLFAKRSTGGVHPQWYENIFFADMLSKLESAEQRADLLLEVDVKALAGWLSLQTAQVRDSLVNGLSDTFQNAVRASAAFASRAEQMRLAHAGQSELVTALKRQYARGQLSFAELAG